MSHNKALFITAANRPNFFQETINSWKKVRGLDGWNVVIRLEPCAAMDEMLSIANQLPNAEVVINPQVYGVLHHPWVGFEELFSSHDFVVRAEDDLPVGDDILEYFSWADESYRDSPEIAAVVGYTDSTEYSEKDVVRSTEFCPWVWGTWKDRWVHYIRDTWDHDYSTFNGKPGNQSGWDWQLNTRVLPFLKKSCIYPGLSRVQNIGVVGVHSTPAIFRQTSSFQAHRGPVEYQER